MTRVVFPWEKNMVDHIMQQTMFGCTMSMMKGEGMILFGYVRNEGEASKKLNLLPSSPLSWLESVHGRLQMTAKSSRVNQI